MKIRKMRTNHFKNPIGYDFSYLSFSWIAESDGTCQVSSRVEVSESPEFDVLISDSGWQMLNSLNYIPRDFQGKPLELKAFTRYYWRVSVKADNGDEAVSKTAYFETAKEGEGWKGTWICAPFEEHPVFTKRFLAKKGQKARICICGVGLY